MTSIAFGKSDNMEWVDHPVLEGVKIKVMYRDDDEHLLNMFVRLPPGFQEPEHSHDAYHSEVVLEGMVEGHGQQLGAGDTFFAGRGIPHGPFVSSEGCTLFVSFRGESSLFQPSLAETESHGPGAS